MSLLDWNSIENSRQGITFSCRVQSKFIRSLLNKSMWSFELLNEAFRLTKPGGTFATFSASGEVRKNLNKAGFFIKKVNSLDAVILAGGKGSRIKKFLNGKPKPLVKISNYYFLDLLIGNISKYNFSKIYILAGYRGSHIYKKYHNKFVNFVPIACKNSVTL